MFKATCSFRVYLLHRAVNSIRGRTQINYGPPWNTFSILRTSSVFDCQQIHFKARSKLKNCISIAHASLFSDERESHLRDERTVFVRDVPEKVPDIKEKLRDHFSSFGDVERVRRVRQNMLLVSFSSVESASKVLKEKHFFEGQWITTLPIVKKGCWKGKSCKVKVESVPQTMMEKELVNYFCKFGTVTNIDFIILDPDTLERKNFCFVEFSKMSEAKKAASVELHKVGQSFLRVHISTSKLSAVKNTKEIIVRSLPHNVTVDELREYFEQFGALEQVNLICQVIARPHTTYAFVKFQSPCAVEKATDTLIHKICGKKTVVQKSALSHPIQNGDRKIFVEGFQPHTDPKRVRAYFEVFGKLEHITDTGIRPTGKTHVIFKSKASLQHVFRQKEHVLDGCILRIRPVSWRRLDPLTSLINMNDESK